MYGGPLSKCWKDTQRNFLIEIRHIQDVWRDADIALLHHECLNQVTDRNLLFGRYAVYTRKFFAVSVCTMSVRRSAEVTNSASVFMFASALSVAMTCVSYPAMSGRLSRMSFKSGSPSAARSGNRRESRVERSATAPRSASARSWAKYTASPWPSRPRSKGR